MVSLNIAYRALLLYTQQAYFLAEAILGLHPHSLPFT